MICGFLVILFTKIYHLSETTKDFNSFCDLSLGARRVLNFPNAAATLTLGFRF